MIHLWSIHDLSMIYLRYLVSPPSTYIYLPFYPSINLSIYQSIYLSFYLYLSFHLFNYHVSPLHLYRYVSIYISIYLSIINLSIFLYIYEHGPHGGPRFPYLSLYNYLSINPSIFLSIYLQEGWFLAWSAWWTTCPPPAHPPRSPPGLRVPHQPAFDQVVLEPAQRTIPVKRKSSRGRRSGRPSRTGRSPLRTSSLVPGSEPAPSEPSTRATGTGQ